MGDVLPPWQATLQTLGVKIRPADLQKMTARAQFDLKQDAEAIRQQIFEQYMNFVNGKTSKQAFEEYAKERMQELQKRAEKLSKKLGK